MRNRRVSLFLVLALLLIALPVNAMANKVHDDAVRVFLPLVGRYDPVLSNIAAVLYSEDSEIYTLRGDGTALQRLTNNDVGDDSPRWSPDGARILWQRSLNGRDLWLMNRDGSDAHPLTDYEGDEFGVWSPDGTRVAIHHYRPYAPENERQTLYLASLDTKSPIPVISHTYLRDFAWSPTGEYLAFRGVVGQNGDHYYFYTVKPDGTALTSIVEGNHASIRWSPDGAWLAYTQMNAGNADVYIVSPDGSDTRRLTGGAGHEVVLGWVDGGARLLVEAEDGLYLIRISDGTSTAFFTFTDTRRTHILAISPDGRQVAYNYPTLPYFSDALYVQATDSVTPTAISPVIPCGHYCGIYFGGWSRSGDLVTYAYIRYCTCGIHSSRVYSARTDAGTLAYRDHGYGWSPRFLPASDWVTAYMTEDRTLDALSAINARTGDQIAYPRSADDTALVRGEFHYDER